MTKKDPFRRGRLLLWLCEEHQGQQPLLAGQRHDAPGERPAQLMSELTGTPHVTKFSTRNLGLVLLLTNLSYYNTQSSASNHSVCKSSCWSLLLDCCHDVGDGGSHVADVPLGDGPQVDPSARGQDVDVVAVGQGLALGRGQVGVVEHPHLESVQYNR